MRYGMTPTAYQKVKKLPEAVSVRVLYVTSTLPFGSGEAFVIPEVEELQRQGHAVRVVPLYPRGRLVHQTARALLDRALVQPAISWSIVRGAALEVLRRPRRALRALRLLVTWRPSHLLKNLCVYPKGLWLAGVARHWRAEHIHAHWAATTASLAMVASEVSGIPWSFTAHRWDIVEGNLLAQKAEHAAFVRFISENGLKLAVTKGVPQGKARVLHMGVRLPALQEPRGDVTPRPFRLLCPAALLPVKGHRYLIEAMARLDGDTELWLAGEGPLRYSLERQVIELGLQGRVRFLGQLAHEALLRVYEQRQIDAVVLPSIDLGNGVHEGIPVALMEAMAYALPVISTRTGGIPELLGDGAGLLVPPGDADALASAIDRLRKDPKLRSELGDKGRRRVEQEFSIEKVSERLSKWFAESMAK